MLIKMRIIALANLQNKSVDLNIVFFFLSLSCLL